MEGMPNIKYEQVKKDLELKGLYECYYEAFHNVMEALDERMETIDDDKDLWHFVYDVWDSFQHDATGMKVLIDRKPSALNKRGRSLKLDYSDLD